MNKRVETKSISFVTTLVLLLLSQYSYAQMTCADLPTFMSGGSFASQSGKCAPVTATLEYRISFAAPLPTVRPTGGSPNYQARFIWNDGQAPAFINVSINPLSYVVSGGLYTYTLTANRIFPGPAAGECDYQVVMIFLVDGNSCQTGQLRQTQVISSWRTDAYNQGNVQLLAPAGGPVHEVCEGVDISVIFNDATNFNCNANYPASFPPNAPINDPNQQIRWQQIVYNTPNGAPRIPNVEVDGVAMPPAAGSNYQDPRGVFVMTPLVVVNDGRRRPTLQITAPGGFGAGFPVAGDEFEITIRYWNTCNPYDDPTIPGPPADLINGDSPPVERTALIRIIDAPDRPTVPDVTVCGNDSRTITVTSGNPGPGTWRYRWYSDAALTNQVFTNTGAAGRTWTPGDGGGANQISVNQRKRWWVTVENVAAGSCRSEAEEVVLTRRQALTTPAITGPQNLCPGGTYVYSVGIAADPVTITDVNLGTTFNLSTQYVWTVPSGGIDLGQNTQTITMTAGAAGGSGNVTAVRRYTDNSPGCGTQSTRGINVRARPTVNISPDPATVCEGNALTLDGNANTTYGTISGHLWGGAGVGVLSDTGIEEPDVNTSAPGNFAVTYVTTADFGGGVTCTSNPDNLTINITASPTSASVGSDQQHCATLTSDPLGGSNPSPGTGTWSKVSGPGNVVFSGGVNNPAATATVDQPGVYELRWRVVNGSGPGACISEADITVDFGADPGTPDAGSAGPFCGFDGALNAVTPPTGTTITWTQFSGPGTTTFSATNTRNPDITVDAYGTYVYRYTVSSGTCTPQFDDVTVEFFEPATVQDVANFTTCVDGTSPAAISLSGTFGGGASNARWEVVAPGSGTFTSSGTGTGNSDATSPATDSYTPSAGDFTVGSVQVRLITNDPTGPCPAVSDLVTITIDRKPADAEAGSNASVCGGSYTLSADAATNGGEGTWTGPGYVSFGDIHSPTTTVTGLANGSNLLRWTVRSALHGTPGSCSETFEEITITRNTLPTNNDPAPERCVDVPGGTVAQFTLADLTAMNDAITGIAGSTDRVVEYYTDATRTTPFTGPANFANGDKLYTIVRRTDVTPNCPQDGEITFVIHPRPDVTPQAPEFCEDLPVGSNTHAGIDLTAYNDDIKNNVAANTVAWFVDALRTITVPDPTNVTANNGTKFYARVTNPTTLCSDTTSLEVIVNPRPVPNPLIGPTNVCADASSAVVYQLQTNNVASGYTFSWSIPAPPFVQMLGGTSNDYLVLMNFPSIVNPGQNIEVTEISDKGCHGVPNVINVTVETSPPPIVITNAGGASGPFAVCANEAGVVFRVPNLANTTYAWTVPAGSSIISGQGTNQITVNFGVLPGIISVTPTTTTGCPGTPANASVAINERPVLASLSDVVCSDSPGGITLVESATSPVPAASFNITNVTIPAGLSPASRATGNNLPADEIENDIFTNTTGGNLVVQYTVVPVSAQSCAGDPRIVNLTVQPEPVLDPNLADAICSANQDVNIVLKVAVGSFPADVYRIASINNPDPINVTQVAGVQVVPGNYSATILTDDRWRNVGTVPVTIEYMVHPINSGTNCIGDPAIPVRVTVYPEPHVLAATETICSGDTPTLTLTTSPLIAGSTFTWTVKSITGLITGTSNGTGATITNVLVNNDVTSGTVTYEVRATGDASVGGCQGPPTDVVITVDPAPLTTNVDQVVCSTTPGTTEYVEDLVALQPAINADGSLTFSWHTSQADALANANAMSNATASAYPLQNGIPVFVRVSNGQCARVMAVTYTVNPTPSFGAAITSNYSGAQLSCNNSSNGIITVTPPVNGTAPYLYSIDGGTSYFTSLTFNGLSAAGNPYIVQVRDSRGCIAQAAPLNFVPPPVLTATPAITSDFNGQHIRCHGENNGEVTVTASGGVGTLPTDYTYSILELPGNITGATTGVFTGLTAGSYTFVVRDANNCSVTTTTITLIDPPAITATATLTNPVVCFGESNGEITVTANGGTLDPLDPLATYTYTINPGGTTNTTGLFNGLAAGTYMVNVTDNNGCVRSSNNVTVTQPAALAAFASVTSNYHGAKISCPGANDAVITVIANGGNGGYAYILMDDLGNPIANTTGDVNGIYTGVGPGNYTVQVTDSRNCTVVTVPVNITEPLPIDAATTIISNITCNGVADGQIRVTAVGGTGAYSYEQINPAGPTNATGIFTGLGDGVYDFRVTDLNGCFDVVQVTLNQPAAVTASAVVGNSYNGAQLSCHNSSDGVITVTASGGTGALHYVFDQFALTNTTGAISGVFTGVPAGTNYTFTVRDANNCTVVTIPVDVVPPTVIVASGTVTSDFNGEHISCPTATDGVITVTASGGTITGTYTYRIDQLPLNTSGLTSGIFTGVGAGVYTVTVRDANNCFVMTAPITVTPPAAVTATTTITSNHNGRHISCFGASDGEIRVTPGGGVAPYTYILNEDTGNTSGATSGIFSGLAAGTYTVTVTDFNGCQAGTSPVTLTQPAVLAANGVVTSNYNGQQISCFGASDGIIRVTATGGTQILTPSPHYNYSIVELPLNTTGATTGIFTDLPAGTYTFLVEDVNSCSVTTTAVTISEPPVVTASAAVTSNYHGSQVSCNGSADGMITVTASGGTGVLQYVFNENPGNGSGFSSGIFTGVAAGGPYTFTVTDVNGCNVPTADVFVTEPIVLAASGSVTSNHNGHHISCPTATDGTITIIATGGTGAYTYRIDQLPLNTTGLSNGIFTGIGAGSYTATVRDVNGCFIVTALITVTPPPAVTATLSITSNHNGRHISCFGASDGEIEVTPGGGVGPYNFVLNQDPLNTSGATNGIFTGLVAGTYSVTVTDQNGCPVVTNSVTLTQPVVVAATAAVTSNYNGSQITCVGASDGIIRVTPTGGTTPYTYSVVEIPGNVTGQANGIFTGLPAGTYTFNVEDVNGCFVITGPVTITPPTPVVASATVSVPYNGKEISCNGASDGIITITANGGTGDLRYVFDQIPGNQSGQYSGIFSGVPAGIGYTFTVTDVNGCFIQTVAVDVTEPDAIAATGVATSNFSGFNISCFTETDGVITITPTSFGNDNGPLTYMLIEDAGNTSGVSTGIFTGLRAGSFRARITDINGCSFTTAPIIVTQPNNLAITIAKTSNYNGFDVSCDGAADGQISVTSTTGGAGGYTYVLNEDPANDSGETSGVFTGLTAGLYSVTVTDANGCTRASIPVFLSNPIPLFEGIIGLDKQVCDGIDPTIFTQLAAPLGGIGNYTYQWQDSVAGGAWTNIAFAQGALYDPPVVAQTTYYRRLVSSGTCATLASNVVTVTVNPLPIVTVAGYDPYVCEGQPMILYYEFTQGQAPFYFSYTATTYDQSGNVMGTPKVVVDELSGDSKPIIVSPFTDDMRFEVNNVRDFNGCVATIPGFPAPVFVEVLKTKADFTIISPDPQCSGEEFTVQWSAESDVQYTWQWPDDFDEVRGAGLTGTQTASRRLYSQNPGGIQSMPIILNAENIMYQSDPSIPSCGVVSSLKNIRIYPAILPNIIVNPEEVCSNTPINVQNNTMGGNTHRWTVTQDPNGTPQVLPGFPLTRTAPLSEIFTIRNHTTVNPMEYAIRYEMENSAGNGSCAKDTTVIVRVYRESIAKIGSPKDPAVAIPDWSAPALDITFENASTPGVYFGDFEYTWVFSNNNVNTPPETRPSTSLTETYGFADAGVGKRVTLTSVNVLARTNGMPNNGCSTIDEFVFEITMPLPNVAFIATPAAACLPAVIETDNQSTGNLINDWIVYDQFGQQVTTAPNQVEPSFHFNTPGSYTIQLTVRQYATGPSLSTTQTVRIYDNPVASYITSPMEVVFVPDQELYTINRSQSTHINTRYEWDFGDGTLYDTPEPSHKYAVEGLYKIRLVAIDEFEGGTLLCTDTATHNIQARAAGLVSVPNAFTPNPAGPNGGVVDNSGRTMNDVFLPSTKGVKEFHMQIYDRWGNLVFESKQQNRGWDGYDRNNNILPSGVYVYKLVLRMANDQRVTQVGDVTLLR